MKMTIALHHEFENFANDRPKASYMILENVTHIRSENKHYATIKGRITERKLFDIWKKYIKGWELPEVTR